MSGYPVRGGEQLAKAREVAESKHGKCISKSYGTNNAQSHGNGNANVVISKAPFYVVVQAGSWCPICLGWI